MAAAPIYNKAVTCLCDNIAEYHCNTCGDTLCSKCKAIHQKSKATSHHSVVPYGEKLRPEHLYSLSCLDHKGKECNFWCEKCSKATCIDCVTTSHQGHILIKLEAVLKEKTAKLQSELSNLESNELKDWEALMEEAKQMTADFLDKVDKMGKELDVRAKEFHAKVDEIFKASKKQLEDMKKTSVANLQQQEKMVSGGLEKVKQEIRDCEDKLRNGSMDSLLQYEEKPEKMKVPLPKLSPAMPTKLTPSHIISQCLTEMFGVLTEQQAKGAKANIGATSQHLPNLTDQGNVGLLKGTTQKTEGSESKSTPQGNQETPTKATLPTPQRQLIPTPSVQSSFYTRYNSYDQSIVCVGTGLAWVRTGDKKLKLMDQSGAVKDAIDNWFYFSDVVLSPQGEFLLTDTNNKCIRSIHLDRVARTLFRTQWTPYGLCCLHSGDVAVTFNSEGRVVIYNMSGKIVQELSKKLFKLPHGVTQNKVNHDLCVCDKNKSESTSTGKIVALDVSSYHARYKYRGQDTTPFCPMDLCTDSAGRVLIADYIATRVDILDKDGQFIQYLLTKEQGLLKPISIDVDSEGNAWVGEERNGGVKVVKYLQ